MEGWNGVDGRGVDVFRSQSQRVSGSVALCGSAHHTLSVSGTAPFSRADIWTRNDGRAAATRADNQMGSRGSARVFSNTSVSAPTLGKCTCKKLATGTADGETRWDFCANVHYLLTS